ncbi:stressosome-associated protein Prli42 [Paenibacillus beijingensis]|nr:stressosome-associated protein Prli42 [Paenibacillus beijingensis]
MPNRLMRIVVYVLLIALLITTVLSGIGWMFS